MKLTIIEIAKSGIGYTPAISHLLIVKGVNENIPNL
jgi:hypothetical protein